MTDVRRFVREAVGYLMLGLDVLVLCPDGRSADGFFKAVLEGCRSFVATVTGGCPATARLPRRRLR